QIRASRKGKRTRPLGPTVRSPGRKAGEIGSHNYERPKVRHSRSAGPSDLGLGLFTAGPSALATGHPRLAGSKAIEGLILKKFICVTGYAGRARKPVTHETGGLRPTSSDLRVYFL